jgi:hypothetical protein
LQLLQLMFFSPEPASGQSCIEVRSRSCYEVTFGAATRALGGILAFTVEN